MSTMSGRARASRDVAQGGRPAIVVARHGRPALNPKVRVDWRGYEAWWAAYDEGGLALDQRPPQALVAIGAQADVIYASTLRRARETAQAVADGKPILEDARLVEAALPPPPVPGLTMRPRKWSGLARLAWLLGLSRGRETRRAAEERAHDAVAFLIAAAGEDKLVLACAHGWFNRMLRPVFLARGWRCMSDGGDGYWSLRRFERFET